MSKLGICPTTSAWWNFAFAVLTIIGAGSLHFAGLPDEARQIIQSWALDIAVLISCANVVFHLYSADAQGPMVK